MQNEIDPDFTSEGLGLAPIGHVVTVETVDEVETTVSANVISNGEITVDNLKAKVQDAINTYLLELRKNWEDSTNLIIRKARIEALILSIEGVVDVSDVTINEQENNIALEQFEIPILKEVVLQ